MLKVAQNCGFHTVNGYEIALAGMITGCSGKVWFLEVGDEEEGVCDRA